MSNENAKTNILLEEIRGNVKLVQARYFILDQKIEDIKESIKEIGRKLSRHERMPAHAI